MVTDILSVREKARADSRSNALAQAQSVGDSKPAPDDARNESLQFELYPAFQESVTMALEPVFEPDFFFTLFFGLPKSRGTDTPGLRIQGIQKGKHRSGVRDANPAGTANGRT